MEQLVQWRLERMGDARTNSESPFMRQAVDQWLKTPGDLTLRASLLSMLQIIKNEYGYHDVILTSPEGQLLLSSDTNLVNLDENEKQLSLQTYASAEPQFGDFYRFQNTTQVYILISAPILDEKTKPIAVLILQVDPEKYLYPLIQSWPTPSQSAETLLVRKDGTDALFLNTLRYNSAPPLTLRIPLSNVNVPAVQAITGDAGIYIGSDYRGVAVLSDLVPVPGTPWFMIAKVDTDEILAEVRTLGFSVILFVVLSVLMTAVVAYFLFNNHQRSLFLNLYQAEKERREAQEETSTTLYSIGDGVISTDPAGLITRLNPVAERLTGWTEVEAKGKPLAEVFRIINEFTRDQVENPVDRVLREGLVVGLANHTLLIARDNTELLIADSGAPIRDEDRNILGVVLVFRDQTEERAAHKELALLSYVIDHSLNEITLFDAESLKFRYVNKGGLQNLGYSLDHMLTMSPLDIKPDFTPESLQGLIQPLLEHREQALVFETIHRRADGSVYPVEVHMQLFEYEQERVFLSVIQDISVRKQSEETLRKSEENYRLIFEQAADGIFIADNQGNYTDVNSSGCAMLGYTSKEILELGIKDLLVPEDLAQTPIRFNDLGSGKPVVSERRMRRKDGALIDVEISGRRLADGRLQGMVRDISDHKKAEEEIHRLNDSLEMKVRERTVQLESANKELEAFAYSVSHDLRAPLRAMDGFSSALLKDYPDRLDEKGRHYLGRIQEASRRMGQLINDLLSLSRVTRTEFNRQEVNLSALANEIAVNLTAQVPQRKVRYDISPDLIVQGDAHLLNIVLENLLNNAFKFTGQREQAFIQVGVIEQAGERVYFVRDNGVGFDMNYIGKLFAPFQRLHSMQEFPGTGIGLVSVQRIIQRHGGRIWPEAVINQGATFYFTLGGE
ncbi:MAG: PAS domain S-box protein [Anaerolineaceae bacterium]|nr:PAS domain S-box protein [Anaerolineaceae bacterium]